MTADTDHGSMADDLPLLVDGGPTAERAEELRSHVVSCADCARRYWELVDVRDALRHAVPEDPGPGDGASLLRRRLGLAPRPEAPARRRRWAVAAAAVALAFLAGMTVGPPGTDDPPSPAPAEIAAATSAPGPDDAPAAEVVEAYRQSLEDGDQLSRALSYLSNLERSGR